MTSTTNHHSTDHPMRRLGASRVPAWTVAEFAGNASCLRLALVSREWDAAIASSPLWAARVRRAAPLTYLALRAARNPSSALKSVVTTNAQGDGVRPFGLVFPSEVSRDTLRLQTPGDLAELFLDVDGDSETISSETAQRRARATPLHAAVSPVAALETAGVAPEFAMAMDPSAKAASKAAAVAFLDGASAAVAAAVEAGDWRAVAAALGPLRAMSFGPPTTGAAPPSPRAIRAQAECSFYPLAGAPKDAAVVAAVARHFSAVTKAVGVDSAEAAATYAAETTQHGAGYLAKPAIPRPGLFTRLFGSKPSSKRVLCLGDGGTGKTTFLDEAKSGKPPPQQIPTVAFNVESFMSPHNRFNFVMWDVGGRVRLRQLWQHYVTNTSAFLYFVDCTTLFSVYRGREIFRHDVVPHLAPNNVDPGKSNLIVVCTKQDVVGAVLPEAVAAFMSVHHAEPAVVELAVGPSTLSAAPPTFGSTLSEARPGGPLLSPFGTWRFVGRSTSDPASYTDVLSALEEDLGRLHS